MDLDIQDMTLRRLGRVGVVEIASSMVRTQKNVCVVPYHMSVICRLSVRNSKKKRATCFPRPINMILRMILGIVF